MKPTAWRTPARVTASSAACASESDVASGFSHTTSLPAAAAAIATSAWVPGGVQTSMTSRSSRSTSARQSATASRPRPAATAPTRAVSRPDIATGTKVVAPGRISGAVRQA